MFDITDRERQAFAAYGATIVEDECVSGSRVVVDFDSTPPLRTFLDEALAPMKKALPGIRFNSKILDDGRNRLSIER